MAANAEESASASEEMNAQAEQMQAFVGELVNMVGGSSSKGHSRSGRATMRKPGGKKARQRDTENPFRPDRK